jgi:hypothetical protein
MEEYEMWKPIRWLRRPQNDRVYLIRELLEERGVPKVERAPGTVRNKPGSTWVRLSGGYLRYTPKD